MGESWEPAVGVSVNVAGNGGYFLPARAPGPFPGSGQGSWRAASPAGRPGTPGLVPALCTAHRVFEHLLEDVDYFAWQRIVFCQNFSKSRGMGNGHSETFRWFAWFSGKSCD